MQYGKYISGAKGAFFSGKMKQLNENRRNRLFHIILFVGKQGSYILFMNFCRENSMHTKDVVDSQTFSLRLAETSGGV